MKNKKEKLSSEICVTCFLMTLMINERIKSVVANKYNLGILVGFTSPTGLSIVPRPTWQVTGCVIIVAVILDKRGRWRNVAGLHRGHTGSSGHRRGLIM